MSKDEISIDQLREVLRYDADTGLLFWKRRPVEMFSDARHSAEHSCAKWNAKHADKEAFTSMSNGRKEGRVFGRAYKAHRVAWALYHGVWPGEVDHINRDATDNRMANLRQVSHHQNMMNQSSTKGSTSRYVGVAWDKSRTKWTAQITTCGKPMALGRFDSEVEAALARDAAARLHFGEFASLNFPDTGRTTA